MPAEVLITGGAGFLGVAVAKRLLARHPGLSILLSDLARHPRLAQVEDRCAFQAADLTDPAAVAALVGPETRLVFHFASLVSGGAEKDFAAGMAANLHATISLLEACRTRARAPRLVFPSSIATYGGRHLPEEVDDRTHQHPQNSYGVAKVCCEQLISDASRKGFLDGRAIRLPAIVVRDEPNSAASGYASALIREPLAGRDYVCPVSPTLRIPILGLERCIDVLVALGDAPAERIGDWRAFNAPSLAPSAQEILDATRRVGAGRRLGRVEFRPDPAVESIMATWPRRMRAQQAEALGLGADDAVDAIVRDHLSTLAAGAAAG